MYSAPLAKAKAAMGFGMGHEEGYSGQEMANNKRGLRPGAERHSSNACFSFKVPDITTCVCGDRHC